MFVLMGGMGCLCSGSYVELVVVFVVNVVFICSVFGWSELVVIFELYVMVWSCLFDNLVLWCGDMVMVCGVILVLGLVVFNLVVYI